MKSTSFSHGLFVLTLLGKGILGVAQLAISIALMFGIYDRLPAIARSLTAGELAEDPGDFLAGRLLAAANALPETHSSFFAVYFAAHGLLHVAIVGLLLSGRVWAYPFGIVVLAAFILYQLFEWMSVGGAMLIVLSAIDLLVILLTVLEWRNSKTALEKSRG